MVVMKPEVAAMTEEEAQEATKENKHGYVWEWGLRIIIDDACAIFKTREELEAFITDLRVAAEKQWPPEEA